MKHLQLSDNNEKTEITESAQKTITVIFVLMIFFYISAAIFAVTILSRNAVFLGDRLDLENALRVAEVKSAEERKIIGSVSETAQEPAPVQEAAPAEEAPAEEPVEEEPAAEETPEPENETKYYSFTSINSTTILHMREEPDLKAKSIYQLKPGTKGYVMELGDDWSRVYAKGEVGYCSNEFLSLTEISKEDIPEEAIEADEAFLTGGVSAVHELTGRSVEPEPSAEAVPAVPAMPDPAAFPIVDNSVPGASALPAADPSTALPAAPVPSAAEGGAV